MIGPGPSGKLMGARKTKMRRRRKRRSHRSGPDDYFQFGPMEFARFGKVVLSRNNATPDEVKVMQANMADALPGIIAEIDSLVESIAEQVSQLAPDRVLHRAWWEFAAFAMGIGSDGSHRPDDGLALRMIDYVQSVIASAPPSANAVDRLTEEAWATLKGNVGALFQKLTGECQMALTAHHRVQNPALDMHLEDFRFRAETTWINVRGERYQAHERQALLDVLVPHSEVLVRLFGVDAPALVEELGKILTKLTFGLGDALNGLEQLQEDAVSQLGNSLLTPDTPDFEAARGKLFDDPDFAARSSTMVGEVFGLDLFDVEKITNLPPAFLSELAWSPGEENEFFAPGELRGWPLRVWPTMKRPFIRLQGRILCFDFFTLFDGFYRVLQRLVFRLAPEYRETWNERQKAISEALPFKYLEKLLPGAQIFRSVHYRWKAGTGPLQWCEADGLLLYDDHLFVVEVKAGAFTYTSPATDLPAHIRSLEGLLKNPAAQGSRFLDYLESAPEVPIFDAEHNEIVRLRKSAFRHVTVCSITLDPFTELAARAQHLRKVGVDIGQHPIWALSIDDLRVYADLLDNPLVFLHFVEQRILAARCEAVDLSDEMDHLGMYLRHNNYSQYATGLVAGEKRKLNFVGYREGIDSYYRAIIGGEEPVVPRQKIPQRILEVVELLARSNVAWRSELASFLLDASSEFRKDLAGMIDEQLAKSPQLGRTRPLSTYGDLRLTVFVWSPSAPRNGQAAVEHAQVVMAANNETSRPLLELEYTADGVLSGAHWQHLAINMLTPPELQRVRKAGAELLRSRVEVVQRKRKVGRNEPCPCGSGLKYKRCHEASVGGC